MTISRQQLISTLEATYPTLHRLTASLTDAQLDFRPGAAEKNLERQ